MEDLQREAVSRDETGSLLLELGLVVPVILFLALAGLEFSSVLRQAHLATVLSRELGSVAFRDCSSERDENRFDATDCLQNTLSDVLSDWSTVAPGTQVVLTVFSASGGLITQEASVSSGAKISELSVSDLNKSSSEIGKVLRSNSQGLTAEVFVPYRSLIGPMVQNLMPFQFIESKVVL